MTRVLPSCLALFVAAFAPPAAPGQEATRPIDFYGKKVTVLKFKKGNQYKISRGHRQNYTAVQVSDIKL